MKRSEALQIIANGHAPGYDYDPMEAAEETLAALEQAGMLPPLRDRTEHERKIFGTKEDDFDMGFGKRKWEPED